MWVWGEIETWWSGVELSKDDCSFRGMEFKIADERDLEDIIASGLQKPL